MNSVHGPCIAGLHRGDSPRRCCTARPVHGQGTERGAILFVRSTLRPFLAVVLYVPILGVTAASAAQLTASWMDSSGGQAAFRIDRKKQSDTGFTALADVPVGVTVYVDATITEGIAYCYRVKAYNAFGESPYSEAVCGVAAPSTYTLTVTKTGAGAGTVASNPAGITCGIDCTEIYSVGKLVTLAATAAAGSKFDGWAGGCTGTASCTIAANAAVTVTATFSMVPVTVSGAPKPGPALVTSGSPAPTTVASPAPGPTVTPVIAPVPGPETMAAPPTPLDTPTAAAPAPTSSLLASVQNFVRTFAPHGIMAQVREYLEPLFTPLATAGPTPSTADQAAPTPPTAPTTAPVMSSPTPITAIIPPASTQATLAPIWTPQAQSIESGKVSYRLAARVTEPTWIRVRMDDGRVIQETVRAGAMRQWISNGRFFVSVGDAGAVTFELNGRPLAPLGAPGTVVSGVLLPPEGMRPR